MGRVKSNLKKKGTAAGFCFAKTGDRYERFMSICDVIRDDVGLHLTQAQVFDKMIAITENHFH